MDLIYQLLYYHLLLLQHTLQLLNLLSTRLDVQMVSLITHVRLVALLTTSLLCTQTLVLPVTTEHTLLEERFTSVVALHLCLSVSRSSLTGWLSC